MPGGTALSSSQTPRYAIARPSGAEARPSSTHSVSNCFTRRARPAPSAARTQNSRCRPDARASIRFATFAHAISNTIVTAPIIVNSTSRTSSGMNSSDSGARRCAPAVAGAGCSLASTAAIDASSDRACAMSTPGFRRPIAICERLLLGSLSAIGPIGIHAFWFSGKLNFGGITATTVCGRPFTEMLRPTIPASPW